MWPTAKKKLCVMVVYMVQNFTLVGSYVVQVCKQARMGIGPSKLTSLSCVLDMKENS